jgi:hypothetical protein
VSSFPQKLRSAVKQTAVKLPVMRSLVQLRGRRASNSQNFRDLYSHEIPSAATPFHIFADGWSSAVPGFATGKAELFDDFRIKWLEEHLGSFQGKRVLELGPLEGGHTFMMEHGGAEIIAIEANQRAFLKCLVVKNALNLKSEFLFGDFRPYLEKAKPGSFDFVLAVGVLYHMLEPLKLLHDIAAVTNAFGLWTHYYDPQVIHDKVHFNPRPVTQSFAGKSTEAYEQHYLSSVATKQFIGGSAPTSRWLTRAGLLGFIEHLGFRIEVGDENLKHPNGPCILLFARRLS